MRGLVVLCALAAAGACACSSPAADGLAFDPCGDALTVSAAGASTAQLAGIDAALAAWSALGVRVTRVAADGDVPVEFRADPASTEYGLYDDAAGAIYVNTSVTDPAALAVTVAHELGHAVGLVHIAPEVRVSVMNPGNLIVAPTPDDAAAVRARWGGCP